MVTQLPSGTRITPDLVNGMEITDELRPIWLAARMLTIGSSEVPDILGIGYSSPLEVYGRKLGLIPPLEDSPRLRRGRWLEPALALMYEEKTGKPIVKTQVWYRKGSLSCTLDGERDDERDVEFKTVSAYARHVIDELGEEGTDEIPKMWLAQTQAQLLVTGRKVKDVGVFIGGEDFRVYTVEASAKLHEEVIIPAVAEFQERLKRREAPPAERAADLKAQALLAQGLHGEATLGSEAMRLWEAIQGEKDAIQTGKEAEDGVSVLKAQLNELFGDAEIGKLPNGIKIKRKVVSVAGSRVSYDREGYRYFKFRELKNGK